MQLYLEETMESLWQKLQDEVNAFNNATREKRHIYNELLSKDKKGVSEVAENNKRIQKLMDDVGKLKEALTGTIVPKGLRFLINSLALISRKLLKNNLLRTKIKSGSTNFQNVCQHSIWFIRVSADILLTLIFLS